MAGHSHWARIKHQKGVTDARRGRYFSKLARHISSAVRQGGPALETNLKLQYAVAKAREASMPKENIERAIQRASGNAGEGVILEESLYEAVGPGGSVILIEALTDNKNRTAAELRSLLEKGGGRMGGAGSAAWNFEKKGMIWLDPRGVSEEAVLESALAAGADDMDVDGEDLCVSCSARAFSDVRSVLERAGLRIIRSEIAFAPKTTIPLAGEAAERAEALLTLLEDHDDVQAVAANFTTGDRG